MSEHGVEQPRARRSRRVSVLCLHAVALPRLCDVAVVDHAPMVRDDDVAATAALASGARARPHATARDIVPREETSRPDMIHERHGGSRAWSQSSPARDIEPREETSRRDMIYERHGDSRVWSQSSLTIAKQPSASAPIGARGSSSTRPPPAMAPPGPKGSLPRETPG